jgi:hypothetical protein
VGDRDRRAPFHQAFEGCLDEPLRDGVEGRGRFIEDQDPRILEQYARDRDPLLLAARQLVAALADERVIPLGQFGDALVDGRGARRHLELRVGGPGLGVVQVVADGRVEQVRLLGHDADHLAERGKLDPPDVDAVDLDGAGVHVVQPRNQVRGRGLARAGRTDQRDQLTRLRLEVDVLERERLDDLERWRATVEWLEGARFDGFHRGDRRDLREFLSGVIAVLDNVERTCLRRRCRRIAERHVTQPEPAADRGVVKCDGVRRVDDLGIHPEVLEDPVEQGQRALDLDLDVEQLAEGEEQATLERGEGDDRAGRRRRRIAVRGKRPGEPVHECRHDAEDRPDDHEEPASNHRLPDLEPGKVLVDRPELRDRVLLLAERLRQQHSRHAERLLGRRTQLGERLLGLGRDFPADLADAVGEVHEEGQQSE